MDDEELLLEDNGTNRVPLDWSPDGKFLLFGVGDLSSHVQQIWLLPPAGDRKPVPVTQSTFAFIGARFSPDGHWLAYSSNESGRQPIVHDVVWRRSRRVADF
jgi:eukaryotic-like serine/threonine-protein kinase